MYNSAAGPVDFARDIQLVPNKRCVFRRNAKLSLNGLRLFDGAGNVVTRMLA